MSRCRCGGYPAKSGQGVRPWQVAGLRVDVCERRLLRLQGGCPCVSWQVSLVLRTVSVAVRAIRRPGASVHGHMADSVGAADVILQHLRSSEAM